MLHTRKVTLASHLCDGEADGHRAVRRPRGQDPHLAPIEAGDRHLCLDPAAIALPQLDQVGIL